MKIASEMSINDYLSNILKDDVLEKISRVDKSVKLKEPDADMSVQVTGISLSISTIIISKVGHLSCLKDGKLKQKCDYLLITKINDKNYAIFIELKKTLSEEDKPKEQLRRSLPLLDYFLSVCKIEYGNIPKVQLKYAIIAEKNNKRLDKQTTRVMPSKPVSKENHKSIEVMKFITPKISISELVRG